MVSAELQKIFIKVDKGAILWHTFVAHGRPCSWGNCQRYYNEHVKARAAAAALVAASRSSSAPDAGSTGAACPGSTRGSTPSAAAVATPSSRTGASIGVKTLQTSHQAETNARNQRAWWRQYVEAHKQASLEYAEIKKAGLQKRKGSRPDDVAKKWDDTLDQLNKYRITGDAVKQWLAKGKDPGTSPQLSGPKKSAAKLALIAGLKTYAKRQQLEGNTQKPKELAAKMLAATTGTEFNSMVNSGSKRKHMLTALRRGDGALSSTPGESIDLRRVEALTYENVANWFAGWQTFLVSLKFGVWKMHPVHKKLMVYVSKQKRARVVQPDEMHTVMSTELEQGGPRGRVYGCKELGASGRKKVVNARHISAMYSTSGDRLCLPPYYMFDSTAKGDDLCIDVKWVIGLPHLKRFVHGQYEKQTLEPGFEVSTKGGAVTGTFTRWIKACVDPCFPNIAPEFEYDSDGSVDSVGDLPIKKGPIIIKTDLGPDRVEANEEELIKRRKLHEDGYKAYASLPNGTAATQEQDQLYGELKAYSADVADDIVAERNAAAAAARKAHKKEPPINLTNADLGRIVNGRPGDKGKKRPFMYAFSKEKVDRAWNEVGAIGEDGWVTCKALSHPKVRAAQGATGPAQGATGPVPADGSATRTAAADPQKPPAKKSPAKTRVDVSAEVVAAHDASMEAMTKLGFEAGVLEVVPKVMAKKADKKAKQKKMVADVELVDVADPNATEMELSEELKSGTSGMAVFKRGAGLGMWSAQVIDPVLERLKSKRDAGDESKQKQDEDFEKLRQEAIDIVDGCLSIEHLTKAALTTITRYIFTAMGAKGITQVSKDKDAMLINIMDKLGPARLLQLLEEPFKTSGAVPSDWPSLYVPGQGEGSSSSSGGPYLSFADKFGWNEMESMDMPEVVPEGTQPIAAPSWLEAALVFKSETAQLLIGCPIMYNFDADDGGWSAGVITKSCEDEEDTVEVIEGDLTGWRPFNFELTFPDESINVVLELEAYATTVSGAAPGDWCLLQGGKAKRKAKVKAEPKPVPAKGKGKAKAMPTLSAEEKAAKKARLREELAALGSSSDED